MSLSIRCEVSSKPIESSPFCASLGEVGHGAQNWFFGKVRGQNFGKKVLAVEYDAFEPLAEKILTEIAQEAIEKWGTSLMIQVTHRTGRLAVGEISVSIGVSAPHRDEAYQASRYVIEEIKKRAPIWKKEYYENGETEWLKGHALCQHSHSDLRDHAHSH